MTRQLSDKDISDKFAAATRRWEAAVPPLDDAGARRAGLDTAANREENDRRERERVEREGVARARDEAGREERASAGRKGGSKSRSRSRSPSRSTKDAAKREEDAREHREKEQKKLQKDMEKDQKERSKERAKAEKERDKELKEVAKREEQYRDEREKAQKRMQKEQEKEVKDAAKRDEEAREHREKEQKKMQKEREHDAKKAQEAREKADRKARDSASNSASDAGEGKTSILGKVKKVARKAADKITGKDRSQSKEREIEMRDKAAPTTTEGMTAPSVGESDTFSSRQAGDALRKDAELKRDQQSREDLRFHGDRAGEFEAGLTRQPSKQNLFQGVGPSESQRNTDPTSGGYDATAPYAPKAASGPSTESLTRANYGAHASADRGMSDGNLMHGGKYDPAAFVGAQSERDRGAKGTGFQGKNFGDRPVYRSGQESSEHTDKTGAADSDRLTGLQNDRAKFGSGRYDGEQVGSGEERLIGGNRDAYSGHDNYSIESAGRGGVSQTVSGERAMMPGRHAGEHSGVRDDTQRPGGSSEIGAFGANEARGELPRRDGERDNTRDMNLQRDRTREATTLDKPSATARNYDRDITRSYEQDTQRGNERDPTRATERETTRPQSREGRAGEGKQRDRERSAERARDRSAERGDQRGQKERDRSAERSSQSQKRASGAIGGMGREINIRDAKEERARSRERSATAEASSIAQQQRDAAREARPRSREGSRKDAAGTKAPAARENWDVHRGQREKEGERKAGNADQGTRDMSSFGHDSTRDATKQDSSVLGRDNERTSGARDEILGDVRDPSKLRNAGQYETAMGHHDHHAKEGGETFEEGRYRVGGEGGDSSQFGTAGRPQLAGVRESQERIGSQTDTSGVRNYNAERLAEQRYEGRSQGHSGVTDRDLGQEKTREQRETSGREPGQAQYGGGLTGTTSQYGGGYGGEHVRQEATSGTAGAANTGGAGMGGELGLGGQRTTERGGLAGEAGGMGEYGSKKTGDYPSRAGEQPAIGERGVREYVRGSERTGERGGMSGGHGYVGADRTGVSGTTGMSGLGGAGGMGADTRYDNTGLRDYAGAGREAGQQRGQYGDERDQDRSADYLGTRDREERGLQNLRGATDAGAGFRGLGDQYSTAGRNAGRTDIGLREGERQQESGAAAPSGARAGEGITESGLKPGELADEDGTSRPWTAPVFMQSKSHANDRGANIHPHAA